MSTAREGHHTPGRANGVGRGCGQEHREPARAAGGRFCGLRRDRDPRFPWEGDSLS